MHVWEDNTQQRLEVEREQKEDEVRMEQQFANLLTTRDWRNAIVLALQMDQPRRLLNLFTQVANSRPDTTGGLIDDALGGSTVAMLDRSRVWRVSMRVGHTVGSQLIQLLNYVRDWNTSTRTSPIAQTLLHAILSTHSPHRCWRCSTRRPRRSARRLHSAPKTKSSASPNRAPTKSRPSSAASINSSRSTLLRSSMRSPRIRSDTFSAPIGRASRRPCSNTRSPPWTRSWAPRRRRRAPRRV